MMPLVAILSTIDTVARSAAFAASRSLASSDARIDFSAVRSFDRIWRLCSRRLTFCRFALRADFVRLATVLMSSLSERQSIYEEIILTRRAAGDGGPRRQYTMV